jgi:hypothetical protein
MDLKKPVNRLAVASALLSVVANPQDATPGVEPIPPPSAPSCRAWR